MFNSKKKVEIWLYDQADIRFEGKIQGFDEYMNLVLEDCEEINKKNNTRVYLGRILLKGDNVSVVREL